MKISQAAERAGLPVKTVRYYADIGLVAPADRSVSGYRSYDQDAVQKLIFIRRARALLPPNLYVKLVGIARSI